MSRQSIIGSLVILLAVAASSPAQTPLGTAFTYQGQLKTNGSPAIGGANMAFTLFDAATLGNQVGPTLSFNGIGGNPPAVTLTDGLFTVSLDFGSSPYAGDRRWLEINVEGNILTPRQELTAAPYAIKTRGVDGHSLDSADGFITDAAFMNDSGRMGVGMTSPRMSVEVRTNDSLYGLPSIGASLDNSRYAFLHIGGSDHALIWNNGHDMRFGMETDPGTGFTECLRITDTGNVGIGTSNPGFPLNFNSSVGDKISLYGQSGGHFGFGVQSGLLQIHADSAASDIALGHGHSAAFTETMRVKGNGNVGIGVTNPGFPLTFNNTVGDKVSLYGQSDAHYGFGVQGGMLQIHTDLITSDIVLGFGESTDFTETMRVKGNGNVGIGTSDPQQKLDVNGWVRSHAVQIVGGSDVAEPFDVVGGSAVKPGMVVCIDDGEIGKMRLAGRAYDNTVAGVISGANGVNPGLTLSQEGRAETDGKHPVALTGRVWVYVDADAGGPISPGNLLTTSDTPGHAMRATDPARSYGAVIGKAMSSLKSGKGLVLVLISLQ